MASETITVTVQKTIYRKPDTNWCILKTSAGICKGVVPFELNDGDCLKLEGKWKVSQFNGDNEFVFNTALPDVPADKRALLHYAVELTKGMGIATEERIWNAYGEKWFEHQDLALVMGISEAVRFCWSDTMLRLTEQAEQTQAIAFLLSHKCTLNMASLAWTNWKTNTISKVHANPFVLADLPHHGFQDVDRGIRQSFDISEDDPRRIDAAVLYVITTLNDKFGTLIERTILVGELEKIIPNSSKKIDESSARLIAAEKIIMPASDCFALKIDYEREGQIWQRFYKTA